MNDKLVWVDVETTGLDPMTDCLLEVGMIVTDLSLNEVASDSIVLGMDEDMYNEYMIDNEFVWAMHKKSGLEDLVKESPVNTCTVTNHMLDFLSINGIPKKSAYMCGSSVHFDRTFLKSHCPKLHDFFHYRNLDVSSLDKFAEIIGPTLVYVPTVSVKHRALDDIRMSIAKFKYYKSLFNQRRV
jgi:oligoribonuclease